MNRLPEIKKLAEENEILLKKIETLSNKKTALTKLLRARRKALPSKNYIATDVENSPEGQEEQEAVRPPFLED